MSVCFLQSVALLLVVDLESGDMVSILLLIL